MDISYPYVVATVVYKHVLVHDITCLLRKFWEVKMFTYVDPGIILEHQGSLQAVQQLITHMSIRALLYPAGTSLS